MKIKIGFIILLFVLIIEIFNFFNNKYYQHPIAFSLFRLFILIIVFIFILISYVFLKIIAIKYSEVPDKRDFFIFKVYILDKNKFLDEIME